MRRRKDYKFKLTLITIFIAFISLSIGYSFFSETLNISGFVSAIFTLDTEELEIDLQQSAGRYSNISNMDRITFQSETLNNNELTLVVARSDTTGRPNDRTFTINFTNSYPINLTNGSTSTQIISSGADINSLSASLNRTSLIPGESATLTFNVSQRNRGSEEVLAIMSFNAGGQTQYFYYRIIFA